MNYQLPVNLQLSAKIRVSKNKLENLSILSFEITNLNTVWMPEAIVLFVFFCKHLQHVITYSAVLILTIFCCFSMIILTKAVNILNQCKINASLVHFIHMSVSVCAYKYIPI